jgi:bacterioferritin-associated ferredoxin
MYACICAAVDESQVLDAIDDGADTVQAVGHATSAGTGCGSCHERIEDLIESRCGVCPLAARLVA